jgi:CRP/FNR family transcriptional activator FtrB
MKPGSEALRALPVVGECSDDQLGWLNEASDLVRVGPDEDLFLEGEILQELTFLVVGQVGAIRSHPGGRAHMLDVLLPVRPLYLAATMLGSPTPAGARTVTSARLIVFPVGRVRAMIRDDPALGQRLLDYSLHESQVLMQEVYALKFRSAVQRLAAYLLDRVNEAELSPPRFVLPFEKRMLAAKIGCSQENLSRAFATLRRIGVETQRGIVLVRNLAALREFVAPITTEETG